MALKLCYKWHWMYSKDILMHRYHRSNCMYSIFPELLLNWKSMFNKTYIMLIIYNSLWL